MVMVIVPFISLMEAEKYNYCQNLLFSLYHVNFSKVVLTRIINLLKLAAFVSPTANYLNSVGNVPSFTFRSQFLVMRFMSNLDTDQ